MDTRYKEIKQVTIADGGGTNIVKPPLPEEKQAITTQPIEKSPGVGGGGPGSVTSSISTGFGLALSFAEIEEIIQKLKVVSAQLREAWNQTLNGTLAQIENSWAGADAVQYTEKVRILDPRVERICQAIDLLAQTYQKALSSSMTTESNVAQQISSINNY